MFVRRKRELCGDDCDFMARGDGYAKLSGADDTAARDTVKCIREFARVWADERRWTVGSGQETKSFLKGWSLLCFIHFQSCSFWLVSQSVTHFIQLDRHTESLSKASLPSFFWAYRS
jgi:hypothetical protein